MPSQNSPDPGTLFSLANSDPEIEWETHEVDEFRESSQLPWNGWKRLFFFLVNVWLVFHLFAIVICPASVDPSSPVLQSGFDLVAPYLHLIYLDHGFHYFAPEPGPSTLISYTLEFSDGSKRTGRMPNRTIFPRLWYHRHFMLTEFLGNGPEELQPLVERAFARNLCRQSGALRVSLTKVEHHIPSVEDVHRGLKLNDPSLFKETPLGTYTPEELKRPMKLKPQTTESAASPDVKGHDSDPPKDSP